MADCMSEESSSTGSSLEGRHVHTDPTLVLLKRPQLRRENSFQTYVLPRLARGPCFPVPEDVLVIARLVACHEVPEITAPGRLNVHGYDVNRHEFAIQAKFKVANNLSCFAFRLVHSPTLQEHTPTLFLAFNWFAPEGLVDYIRLGSSVLWNNKLNSDDW